MRVVSEKVNLSPAFLPLNIGVYMVAQHTYWQQKKAVTSAPCSSEPPAAAPAPCSTAAQDTELASYTSAHRACVLWSDWC